MNTALAPLPPIGRSRQVMEAVADYIHRSGLKPGDRLPAERELMSALAVGRSSVREAVSQLSALGVVETRIGSGTYLRRPVSAQTVYMPLSLTTASFTEALKMTLEVRRGIEIEASIAAARRRTDEDLQKIEAALIEIDRTHHSQAGGAKADLAFHLAIYDASRNPLFSQLLEQIRGLFEQFWQRPFGRSDFAARSYPFHRSLFEAIRDGDSAAAAEETKKILDIVDEDIRIMSK